MRGSETKSTPERRHEKLKREIKRLRKWEIEFDERKHWSILLERGESEGT